MAFRRTMDVEPDVRVAAPEVDPVLRDELDPDPLIEEMVGRLREGLSSLTAMDEWGRPLAWRNVVRLALGPMASRLRDTEQALELAVSMMPPTAEESVAPEAPAAEAPAPAIADVLAREAPVAEGSSEPPAKSHPTVDVILPASQAVTNEPIEMAAEVAGHAILVEEPIVVDVEPEPEVQSQPVAPVVTHVVQQTAVPGATALFTVSGDQRSVPVSPLSPGQLLRGGSPDDSTTAKYDRFLTGLYGERKQVRRDEDRGSGSSSLRDNL